MWTAPWECFFSQHRRVGAVSLDLEEPQWGSRLAIELCLLFISLFYSENPIHLSVNILITLNIFLQTVSSFNILQGRICI